MIKYHTIYQAKKKTNNNRFKYLKYKIALEISTFDF